MSLRQVTVCENCRTRKVKCDRLMPCAGCKRSKKQCTYRSTKRPLEVDINNNADSIKIPRLSNSISVISSSRSNEIDNMGHINIYKDFYHVYVKSSTVRSCFGPFSWVSFMKSDSALKHVWDYIDLLGVNNLFKAMEGVDPNTIQYPNSKQHQYLTGAILGATDRAGENSSNLLSLETQQELSESYILSIFPTRKVVWALIRRFFKIVYPYMPIIDERDFKSQISNILDEESLENIPFSSIQIKDKIDLANFGILLVILRISYISYLSTELGLNDPTLIISKDSKSLDRKFILENPISLEFVSLSQKCLERFDMFERSSIIVFQLALLLRTYRHLAPEQGDTPDGAYAQIFTSTLVSMANNLGLNREPSESESSEQDNLFRKLIFHLKELDSFESVSYGTPTCFNLRFFDVKQPEFDAVTSNLIDIQLEREVISTYTKVSSIYESLIAIYDLAININSPISIDSLSTELQKLTSELLLITANSNITSLENALEKKSSLLGLHLILSINSLIFVHYEDNNDSTKGFKFMYECMKLIKSTIIPNLLNLRDSTDNMAIMTIVPILKTLYLKSFLILSTMLIRTNISIQKEEKGSERSRNLILLSIALRNSCIELLEIFSIFGTRYYYLWRINRGCNEVLKICFSKNFHQPLKEDPNCALNFSTSEVKEILMIFYNSLGKETEIETIDINSVISAEIPEISNNYISGLDLNRFWYIIKRNSRSNKVGKSTTSEITLSPSDFVQESSFDLEYFNGFYNEFYNNLFSTSEILQ
ncbi:fungal transcriptional regulatory protein [Scheffersomyces coipomensis]|uniref:fungal transcriptional regulatory protein n=1 Tax=Scheffersomyces coipomensis TaxID=1788519 RepID=UPI00315DB0B7